MHRNTRTNLELGVEVLVLVTVETHTGHDRRVIIGVVAGKCAQAQHGSRYDMEKHAATYEHTGTRWKRANERERRGRGSENTTISQLR